MLHKAARLGRLDAIRQFIHTSTAYGHSIDFLDAFDADGVTPLHMAIMHGHVDCVVGLLEFGCDPSIACNGIPVLHLTMVFAALPHKITSLTRILQELVERGASLVARDEEGQNIMHVMAKYGMVIECLMGACCTFEGILQRLNSHGTGIPPMSVRDDLLSQQDAVADTPFHVAAKRGNISVLRFFVENCTKATCSIIVRMVNDEGNTPLHAAAMNGHAEVAAILFALDPTCGLVLNALGKTPLQLAKDHGHKVFAEMLGKLLECGLQGWPTRDELLTELREPCLPTWIITSNEFRRHKTFPDQCKLRSLPPENHRRWSVLVGPENGILRTKQFADLCWHPIPSRAQASDILKVHDFNYFDNIQRQCLRLPSDNSQIDLLDGDTVISHGTFGCALLAAGCVCEAVDIIMKKHGRNAFCVVRPPGHHAGFRGSVNCPNAPSASNGFCIFNNVAVGAAYALNVYRHAGIKKVAILDFDVHHGNGTEQCIMNTVRHKDIEHVQLGEEDEMTRIRKIWRPWLGENDQGNIFFASVQGYGQQMSDEEPKTWFYPGSGRSRDNAYSVDSDPMLHESAERDTVPFQPEVDFDEGQEFPRIINVGIGGPGNAALLWKQCWRDKILPVVVDFNPDLILLSAGFDAHRRDEINGGYISIETHHYEWLTRKLTQVANRVCNGRIVSVLEGGYAVQGGPASAFSSSVAAHVHALNAKNFKKWEASEEALESELESEGIAGAIGLKKRKQAKRDDAIITISTERDNIGTSLPIMPNGAATEELRESERQENVQGPSETVQEGINRPKRQRASVNYVALNAEMEKEAKEQRPC